MTTAPSDNDDDRTRIAGQNADDGRTRMASHTGGAARTRIASDGGGASVHTPQAVKTIVGGASAPGASLGHNAFEVGQKIGEFEIQGLVGEGGFGIVYLAYDHSLDRKVALKEYMPSQLAHREQDGVTVVMRSDRHAETFAAGLRSFINEARLLAQFDHHSLVKVYRFWEANGTAYMVMPFYEGTTLKETLKALAAPPDEEWLRTLLAHLLDALEVIHNRQCFHRDVAPDNVLMQPDGTPLLLDFGAARRVIGDMTQALTVILKPGYAPIEQYAEVPNMKQGPWTDIYALASVIYFAITGKAPVPSVARVMTDPLVPLATAAPAGYSDGFLRALDKGLAVRPEDRPQSIAEFRAALGIPEREPVTRYIPGGPAPVAPGERTVRMPAAAPVPATATATAATPPPASSKKLYLIGGGIAALLAVAGALVYMKAGTPPEAAEAPVETKAAPPAPAGAAPDVVAQVQAKLGTFECARLEASFGSGTAVVRGHVAAESDLKRLDSELGAVNGVTRVNAEAVHVVPPSYCGVVAALAPYVRAQSAPPLIALKGGQAAAFEGDKLVTEVTAANFSGFVYADLFDTEGNVVHMLPNPKDRKNEAKAKQKMVIGEDAMFGAQWDIVPPFGKHLLVVINSKPKLFDRERPEIEPAFKYLGVLREALKKQPRDVTANYTFVDFAPKK